MPRALTPAGKAALESGIVKWAALVKFGFDAGTIAFSSLFKPVTYNGDTYTPMGGLGNLAPLKESTDSQPVRYDVMVSGVDISSLSLYLGSEFLGRPAVAYYAMIDDEQNIIDTIEVPLGAIHEISVEEGPTPTIKVSCSAELADWNRPRPARYTQEDHNFYISRQIALGNLPAGTVDTGFRFVPQMENREIIWPTRQFFI